MFEVMSLFAENNDINSPGRPSIYSISLFVIIIVDIQL